MSAKPVTRQYTIEVFLFRTLTKVLGALLLVAMLAYPLDFAVWRLRLALSHGSQGMGSVSVTRVVAAELKGGKEDYYFDGTMTVNCSQSLFPQGGVNACWWQTRHKEIVARY